MKPETSWRKCLTEDKQPSIEETAREWTQTTRVRNRSNLENVLLVQSVYVVTYQPSGRWPDYTVE